MNKFFLNSSLNGLLTHTLTNILVLVNSILFGLFIFNSYINNVIFTNTFLDFIDFTFDAVCVLLFINILIVGIHTYYGFENVILDYVHNIKVRVVFLFFVSTLILLAIL